MESERPPRRVDALPRLRAVDAALEALLAELAPAEWLRPAVGEWRVREVVAHLVDGNLRRLSLDRDAHPPPEAPEPITGYASLVRFLDGLNAEWIAASRRLSPAVLHALLAWSNRQVAEYFAGLDPRAEAAFPVAWAGEASSQVWVDVAREYTEKWHHQQQIRRAVGRPGLDGHEDVEPLLRTLVLALPRAYREVAAAVGTRVEVAAADLPGLAWRLVRGEVGWRLVELAEPGGEAEARVHLPGLVACRLWMHSAEADEVRARSRVEGPEELAAPLFAARGVMV